MTKIKLSESELRSIVRKAIDSTNEPKKSIKVSMSELKNVVKSVLKEYYHPSNPKSRSFEVTADFNIDNNNYADASTPETINFTIVAKMTYADEGVDGISNYQLTLQEWTLVDGSYEEEYLNDILTWVGANEQEVESTLFEKAGGDSYDPNENPNADY